MLVSKLIKKSPQLGDFFVCYRNSLITDQFSYSVLSHHQQNIYLDQDYPCFCHPRGKLQQIVLTEAFGCSRCRRIFVLQPDGLTIEELATTYPYKRRYYWNGKRLRSMGSLSNGNVGILANWQNFVPEALLDHWDLWRQYLGIIVLLLVVFQVYARVALTSSIFNLVLSMAVAISVLIIITIWLFGQG
jgi:hypothetical protein